MPEKELSAAYLQWQLGIFGGILLFLIALLARGCKGYIEDLKEKFNSDIKKLKQQVEISVKKDYIKEEIKPELSELNGQMHEVREKISSLIGREEYHTDIRMIHEKIDRKQDKHNGPQ